MRKLFIISSMLAISACTSNINPALKSFDTNVINSIEQHLPTYGKNTQVQFCTDLTEPETKSYWQCFRTTRIINPGQTIEYFPVDASFSEFNAKNSFLREKTKLYFDLTGGTLVVTLRQHTGFTEGKHIYPTYKEAQVTVPNFSEKTDTLLIPDEEMPNVFFSYSRTSNLDIIDKLNSAIESNKTDGQYFF